MVVVTSVPFGLQAQFDKESALKRALFISMFKRIIQSCYIGLFVMITIPVIIIIAGYLLGFVLSLVLSHPMTTVLAILFLIGFVYNMVATHKSTIAS